MHMTMTQAQFVRYVRDNVKGTTAISVDALTYPDLKKTGNPYVGASKACTMSGLIGFDYQNSVNRMAAKEGAGERTASHRAWGTLTPDRLFVEHKGTFYLQLKSQAASDPIYRDVYGVEIPESSIKPFLPKKYKSSTQADLEGEICVRDVKVVNLQTVRMLGNTIDIIPDAVEAFEAVVYSETEEVPAE
jgi:hypothetical protein